MSQPPKTPASQSNHPELTSDPASAQGSVRITDTLSLGQRLTRMFPFPWDVLKHAGAEPIPNHLKRWWFALGGTALYLFVIQVVTGIMLTFYYVPSPDAAYASVAHITQEIRFGWYIRSLHHWSANFMIVAVMLHLLRVYFTGAYRHPRQLNWMIGVGLLLTTLVFGFTGYSLVYEQMSYWGITVVTNLMESVPLVGPILGHLLKGGPTVGPNTLTRMFIIHIGLLPTVIFLFIGLHITLIRLLGVTELTFPDEHPAEKKKTFPFFPDHLITELAVGLVLMYVLTLLALAFPAGLGEAANPGVTPTHIKPEWYFYASFRLLKITSLGMTVFLVSVSVLVLLAWPFLEEYLVKKWRMPEKVTLFLGVGAFFLFLIFTVWEVLAV